MKVNPADSRKIYSDQKMTGRLADSGHLHEAFDAVLKNSAAENRKLICTSILKKIDEQSAELRRSPSIEGIQRYRQLVREFMTEALNNSYNVDTESKWDRGGNRREFVIVKKINQSLEELMDTIVNQEKSQINLIAKLDEIRGMLVDLYC